MYYQLDRKTKIFALKVAPIKTSELTTLNKVEDSSFVVNTLSGVKILSTHGSIEGEIMEDVSPKDASKYLICCCYPGKVKSNFKNKYNLEIEIVFPDCKTIICSHIVRLANNKYFFVAYNSPKPPRNWWRKINNILKNV